MELLRGLPADLPAAVFVVVHTSPTSPGVLPRILQRAGSLTASYAIDGAAYPGTFSSPRPNTTCRSRTAR